MKRFDGRVALFAVGVVVALCATACNRNSASNMPPAVAKPGPDESFSTIYDTFRRLVEETPVGFVDTSGKARTLMTGTTKVSKELIPPTEGQPYRAIITVVTQSRYSLRHTVEPLDEKSREKNGNSTFGEVVGDKKGEKGVDPLIIPQKSTEETSQSLTAPRPGEERVGRSADQRERKYELQYVDKRWRLVTPLHKETEQSIDNAFTTALGTQF